MPRSSAVLASALVLSAVLARPGGAADEGGIEFFEKQVRPILVARCHECHSGQLAKPKGGLRLDSRAAALKGGETGPAIIPGKPKESLLVDVINYGDLYQMPPKSKLPAEEIAVLTKWVEIGAPWPQDLIASSTGGSGGEFDLAKRKAEHWCWQPIRSVALPDVQNEAWIRQPLDRFILAKLDANGLSPAPPADKRTLIRRAYFDLIGLPPTVEEVDEFLRATDAFEAVVDRLLASPRFGERWARHWLDLVRYAESRGHEFDYNIPNAFEYRDYVIRALNADVPYDQFVVEHVAGDLLDKPRLHPDQRYNESIIGTGFWFLGEWCHSPVDIRKDECDRIDNMLDVFSKTFLGLTVACARCHDHKFDAISQQDYYALAGYLQSSSYRLARFETGEQDRKIAADLAALDRQYRPQIAAAVAKALRPNVEELATMLAADAEKLRSELGVTESDLKGAEIIVDYANPPPGAWLTSGPTFGNGPVRPGQLVLSGDPALPLEVATYGAARRERAFNDLRAAVSSENDPGHLSGWLRAGRTLKTPTFTLRSGYVHYLIEGVGQVYAAVDSHALINGPLHGELVKETGGNSDLPARWITHDLSRYVGHRAHLEFSPKEDEDFRVLMVVEGDQRPAAPLARPNALLDKLLARGKPLSQAEPVAACRELIVATLDLLAADQVAAGQHPRDRAALANWLISQSGFNQQPPRELSNLLSAYAAKKNELIAAIRNDSRLCVAMWDSTPVDESLLLRGNHKTVGPVVPRRLLEAVQGLEPSGAGFQPAIQNPSPDARPSVSESDDSRRAAAETYNAGSGRLDLARELVAPRNPLTSRVLVNRVWHHLLGRGIVPSVDNFGVLGQPPTHPELLDYLTQQFMKDGWSVKRLIRSIMLSSTYQMASGGRQPPEDTAEQADPQNVLFHRQNLKRLEGEAIRDAILAISGRLDETMYVPSVPVYLTPFMQGRGRPKDSGPLDGAGRRSIYIAVRRNFLAPMMLAFDTPIPFTTIGRRNVSNVPAQALILMNDPFVVEQARNWARKLLADKDATPRDRIRHMYLAAFSREPTTAETTAAFAFLDQQAREYGMSGEQACLDERVWADLGHVLFNVKEFIFVN